MAEQEKDVVPSEQNNEQNPDAGDNKGSTDPINSVIEAENDSGPDKADNHDRLLQQYGQNQASINRRLDKLAETQTELMSSIAQMSSARSGPSPADATASGAEPIDDMFDFSEDVSAPAKVQDVKRVLNSVRDSVRKPQAGDSRLDIKNEIERAIQPIKEELAAEKQRRNDEQFDNQLLSVYPKAKNPAVMQQIANVAAERVKTYMPHVDLSSQSDMILPVMMQVAHEAAERSAGTTSPTMDSMTVNKSDSTGAKFTEDSASPVATSTSSQAEFDAQTDQLAADLAGIMGKE